VKKILIVDDSQLVRSHLRVLIEGQPELSVCGEAENGREGIDKAIKLSPDLIVMDLLMPILNGLEASREIKRLLPSIPVVMFTTLADPLLQNEALDAGVDAVVSKSEGALTLVSSIKQLCAGNEIRRPPGTGAK
jgi:DNA-binding NarL/FixJ family response regulator